MSLHSAFPGATGANELTGSGYARQSCTFNPASGGVRNLASSTSFTVGAGHTVLWCGLWNGSSFQAYSPNGGSPREFQVDIAANTVSVLSHGWADGDAIVFYGGTIPTGLVEGTIYYVRDSATNTFKVAATAGGVAIDLTGTGATDCVVSRITQTVYGGADTHTVNTWGIGAVF
jgi:hypothetical protein